MKFGYLDVGCRDLDGVTWGGVFENNHKPLKNIAEVYIQTAKSDTKEQDYSNENVRSGTCEQDDG